MALLIPRLLPRQYRTHYVDVGNELLGVVWDLGDVSGKDQIKRKDRTMVVCGRGSMTK